MNPVTPFMLVFNRQPPSLLNVLQSELDLAYRNLQLVYNRFDQAIDEDLIDASSLEIKAAELRYNWLLRQIKAVWHEEREG